MQREVVVLVAQLFNSPWDQLDEVVVESDAGAGVKDGGVSVAVEVCGHNLSRKIPTRLLIPAGTVDIKLSINEGQQPRHAETQVWFFYVQILADFL